MKPISKMKIRDAQRMFTAGNPSLSRLSWDSTPYTADQVAYHQLEILRNQSREQARNNDYVVRYAQLLQSNVVGANGFKVRSQVIDSKGNVDLQTRSIIENEWENYRIDVGLVELEQLVMTAMVSDGEAFVYLGTDENGALLPELIDPVRIDVEWNHNSEETGNTIIMGIEYDGRFRPVAYWVNDNYSKYHPAVGENAGQNVARTRISADHMLHIFRKTQVNQKRGFPWISTALSRLFQLNRFEEAALLAARVGAAKMGFFYSENELEYTGDGSGDMAINAEAGTFENIGSMRFQAFDPTYPAGEYKTFSEKVLMGISSGWGVDYHSIGNDLAGVNYSSARVGMLETRELYKTLQVWLTNQLVRPIFRRWIRLEKSSGRLPINKSLHEIFPASFVGRSWDWVDPQKEANAQKVQYDMKIKSLSQIIRERGENPADVFSEIAEENALLKQLGITPEQAASQLLKEDNDAEDTE